MLLTCTDLNDIADAADGLRSTLRSLWALRRSYIDPPHTPYSPSKEPSLSSPSMSLSLWSRTRVLARFLLFLWSKIWGIERNARVFSLFFIIAPQAKAKSPVVAVVVYNTENHKASFTAIKKLNGFIKNLWHNFHRGISDCLSSWITTAALKI